MAGKENESNRLFEDEKVIEIEIERLRSFKDHPFKVNDDKEMHLLKDSIKQYGVLNPLIVRPVPDGVYEIISGHRRKYAAQQLGYRKVPVIIRVMNDEEAIIKMVDANLQRERISYSEKAFAYKMKNDAMKRTAGSFGLSPVSSAIISTVLFPFKLWSIWLRGLPAVLFIASFFIL